jgi:hypothetical protein
MWQSEHDVFHSKQSVNCRHCGVSGMKDIAALGIPSRRQGAILLSINTTTTARVYYYLKRSVRCFDSDRLEMERLLFSLLFFKNCVIVQSV